MYGSTKSFVITMTFLIGSRTERMIAYVKDVVFYTE